MILYSIYTMDTILFILFFVLSVFVAFITIVSVTLFIFAILIFKKLHAFLEVIKRETEKIEGDINAVRDAIKNGGTAAISFLVYLVSLFKKTINKKSKK